MIEFRLRQAGYLGTAPLFNDEATRLIYQYTQGYPRKIAMLCHDALEELVMQEKDTVYDQIIRKLVSLRQYYD
jgi:type II secretory pathway predicted ATPase ExeA